MKSKSYKRQNFSKTTIKKPQGMHTKRILTILAVLVCISVVMFYSAYKNVTEMERQLQQNLADVAKQNAVILQSKIEAQYNLLQSLSKELEDVTPETIEAKLRHFEIFLEDFGLKRFAFCFPGGMTYSTDGELTDLSYREFYQKGMEGECAITGVLIDALRVEHGQVNVMTIPIYDEEQKVTGVFGLAYMTEAFNRAMQVESFEGAGYSCIINEQGEILSVTGDGSFSLAHNIYEDLQKADARNEAGVEQLKQYMVQGEEGSGTLYLKESTYYDLIPVSLMDGSVTWYILTFLPTSVLDQRVVPIQKNQYVMSILICLFVGLGALCFVLFIRSQHKQMLQYAYEDPLTHGTNFIKFCLDMESRKKRQGYMVAVDITNFNNIMIVAGEEASDTLIQKSWEIIHRSLGKDELAGRVRDDLFVLFLDAPDEAALIERMEKISEQIIEKARNFSVYGIHAGYGVYQMSGEETVENAYSRAKLAKEYIVMQPELHYAFYNETARVKMQNEKALEEQFPTAIAEREFEVWYQPKYHAVDCTIVGSEALVRWRRKTGEMVSPGEFIPLFERNGMIVKLDEYMFRSVCQQQKKWLDEGKVVYPVSINISRASLYSADVEQRYLDIMKEYNISSDYIQLEVTETVMEKRDVCELLNEFRHMGIKILMDDFGVGYTSLATLSTQCFDTLKLDKTLIDHIGSKDGETLLYHIIRMGQQMGLHITAEGVEKKAQVEFLQRLECDDIQGFYFSRPIPVEEYEAMINSGNEQMLS